MTKGSPCGPKKIPGAPRKKRQPPKKQIKKPANRGTAGRKADDTTTTVLTKSESQ